MVLDEPDQAMVACLERGKRGPEAGKIRRRRQLLEQTPPLGLELLSARPIAAVDRLRRRALNAKPVETFEDLYGRFLLAAAIVLCAGVLVVRKRTELAWQTAGAVAVVLLLASVM